jgi:hypothetical protein
MPTIFPYFLLELNTMKANRMTVNNGKQLVPTQGNFWTKPLFISLFLLVASVAPVFASSEHEGAPLNMTGSLLGIFALFLFRDPISLKALKSTFKILHNIL